MKLHRVASFKGAILCKKTRIHYMSCHVIEDLLGFRHLEWLRVHDFGHTKSHFVVLLRVLGGLKVSCRD